MRFTENTNDFKRPRDISRDEVKRHSMGVCIFDKNFTIISGGEGGEKHSKREAAAFLRDGNATSRRT